MDFCRGNDAESDPEILEEYGKGAVEMMLNQIRRFWRNTGRERFSPQKGGMEDAFR